MLIFIIPLKTIFPVAGFTSSPATRFISVFFVKFMSFWAELFTMYFPTSDIIFRLRNGFEMSWIYAKTVTASMIDVEIFRDFGFKKFVGKTVSPLSLALRPSEFAVPVRVRSEPNPTRPSLSDLSQKSLFYRIHGMRLQSYRREVNAIP